MRPNVAPQRTAEWARPLPAAKGVNTKWVRCRCWLGSISFCKNLLLFRIKFLLRQGAAIEELFDLDDPIVLIGGGFYCGLGG